MIHSQTSTVMIETYEDDDESKSTNNEVPSEKNNLKCFCSVCSKGFIKMHALKEHMKTHSGERTFQCVVCGKLFGQKSNVKKHLNSHKVLPHGKNTLTTKDTDDVDSKLKLYQCQYCEDSLTTYSDYKKHLCIHDNLKVFRCVQSNCNETFQDVEQFVAHTNSHKETTFICNFCHQTFKTLQELGQHQYQQHKDDQCKTVSSVYKCKICSATFKLRESLANHEAIESHNYKCTKCNKVYKSERYLRRHLRSHSVTTQYSCTVCSKRFTTNRALSLHSQIHSFIKPYSCETCGKTFSCKYRLKRHVLVHLNLRYVCTLKHFLGCDKKFYRKDKLKEHLACHMNNTEKPTCQLCFKTFANNVRLLKHMKVDHDGETSLWKCEMCCASFNQQESYTKHLCSGNGLSKLLDNTNQVSNIEVLIINEK